MTRYIISDLHLDHKNIIKYCDRPFEDVTEMNETLITNWNMVVDPEDTVLYLGDFGWWDIENIIEFYTQVNGEMVLVRGNHDEFDAGDVPFSVVESCTISHAGQEFYCEHYPSDVPDEASWWALHGHTHNNELDEFPFINPTERRANVSCELLDYQPISLDTLCELIDRDEQYTTIADAYEK